MVRKSPDVTTGDRPEQSADQAGRSGVDALIDRALVALVVAAWVLLPFTAGESLDQALSERSGVVRVLASVVLWSSWAVGLACLLVPRSVTLTAARIVIPAAVPLSLWGMVSVSADWQGIAGLSLAVASALLVLSAPLGDRFVNGSAYGDERRFALRPPLGVLLGPLPLVWLIAVTGVAAGPFLLASRNWLAGVLAVVAGWPLAVLAIRRVHLLSKRWLVFVPAGLVVVDPMVLASSLLVQRRNLERIGPAVARKRAGPRSMDLTMGTVGLRLCIEMNEPAEVLTNRARREAGGSYTTPGEEVTRVHVAPSRPGLVLREALRRRVRVG